MDIIFYEKTKETALKDYKKAVEKYNNLYHQNVEIESSLIETRNEAVDVIDSIIKKLNKIKNTPEEYMIELGDIYQVINDYELDEYEKKSLSIVKKTNAILITGLAGLGYSLSQVLTNSETKGAENDSDNDVLNNVIALVSLAVIAIGSVTKTIENKKIINQISEALDSIKEEETKLLVYNRRLKNIEAKTNTLCLGLKDYADRLNSIRKRKFNNFTDEEVLYVSSVVNATKTLGKLLSVTINTNEKIPKVVSIDSYMTLTEKSDRELFSIDSSLGDVQSQAIAAWASFLQQRRLLELFERIKCLDFRKDNAFVELNNLKEFISDPTKILGDYPQKHGEIAEHCDVNINNARDIMNGLKAQYSFENVGRLAPEDYLCGGLPIQSKFYNGARGTIKAISKHLNTYTSFIDEGGSYKIASNQYEQIINVKRAFIDNPSSIDKENLKLLHTIQSFEAEHNIKIENYVKPAVVTYDDVQLNVVEGTVNREKENIEKIYSKKKKLAEQKAKPNIDEAKKVIVIGASVEAGLSFLTFIIKKQNEGKSIQDFTADDWKEAGVTVCGGATRGVVRSGAIYGITNYTKVSGNVAAAYVSASFGIVKLLDDLRKGYISFEEFISESEIVCMDVSLSTISATVGQVLIPVPILGSVLGSITGNFVISISKQFANKKEMELLQQYQDKMEIRDEASAICLEEIENNLKHDLDDFNSLEELAFSQESNMALEYSISLAEKLNLSEKEIIKNIKEGREYLEK